MSAIFCNDDDKMRFTFTDEDGNIVTWNFTELGKQISDYSLTMKYLAQAFKEKYS